MALITDIKARSAGPGGSAVPHGGVTGLTLLPSATQKGQGKWVMRFVSPVTGRRRNAGLGAYPQVGIALAGKLGREMREQIAAGEDPLEIKSADRAKPKIPTFQHAAEQLHSELAPGWKNPKHAQQWLNTLTKYAVPLIGSLTLDQIQPRHVAEVLRPIWLEKAETASRVNGFNQANPVDVVTHLLPLQPGKAVRQQHQPAMPWVALPSFAKKELAGASEFDVTRNALVLLILTAGRSGEIRGMTWSEVNLPLMTWTIPAARMKARQVHRVPLSDQVVSLLKRQMGQHEELVFPSVQARSVLSDMALTALLRRVEAQSDTVERVATAHGFRSSFRDWCSENGYARDLAERALAHTVKDKVEAAYHRTDLLEQRRPMMQAWADFILLSAKQPSKDSSPHDI